MEVNHVIATSVIFSGHQEVAPMVTVILQRFLACD